MNEPGSLTDSPTRRVDARARDDPCRGSLFRSRAAADVGRDDRPRPAARLARDLAAGHRRVKADIVRDVLLEPVSVERPPSLLRSHPNCTLFLDRAAAARVPAHVIGWTDPVAGR